LRTIDHDPDARRRRLRAALICCAAGLAIAIGLSTREATKSDETGAAVESQTAPTAGLGAARTAPTAPIFLDPGYVSESGALEGRTFELCATCGDAAFVVGRVPVRDGAVTIEAEDAKRIEYRAASPFFGNLNLAQSYLLRPRDALVIHPRRIPANFEAAAVDAPIELVEFSLTLVHASFTAGLPIELRTTTVVDPPCAHVARGAHLEALATPNRPRTYFVEKGLGVEWRLCGEEAWRKLPLEGGERDFVHVVDPVRLSTGCAVEGRILDDAPLPDGDSYRVDIRAGRSLERSEFPLLTTEGGSFSQWTPWTRKQMLDLGLAFWAVKGRTYWSGAYGSPTRDAVSFGTVDLLRERTIPGVEGSWSDDVGVRYALLSCGLAPSWKQSLFGWSDAPERELKLFDVVEEKEIVLATVIERRALVARSSSYLNRTPADGSLRCEPFATSTFGVRGAVDFGIAPQGNVLVVEVVVGDESDRDADFAGSIFLSFPGAVWNSSWSSLAAVDARGSFAFDGVPAGRATLRLIGTGRAGPGCELERCVGELHILKGDDERAFVFHGRDGLSVRCTAIRERN
jgi:hypothetical protein